jgi:uncharacterized protein (DUF433 family)
MEAPVVHIEIDSDGIPRTINRRVKVAIIAQKYITAGETAEDIATHYGLVPADVHAALVYYYDNRPYFEQREHELQPLIDEAERYSAELKAKILERKQRC